MIIRLRQRVLLLSIRSRVIQQHDLVRVHLINVLAAVGFDHLLKRLLKRLLLLRVLRGLLLDHVEPFFAYDLVVIELLELLLLPNQNRSTNARKPWSVLPA